MIDSKLLRQDAAAIAARLQSRGYTFPLDEYQRLEDARKTAQVKAEQLQATRNSLSAQIGQAKKNGENADALMAQVAALDSEQKDSEQQYAEIQTALDALLATVPNPPHESVPVGKDEDDNLEVRRWGTPRVFDFPPKEHADLENIGRALHRAARRPRPPAPRHCPVHAGHAHTRRRLHRDVRAVSRQRAGALW